MLIRIEIFQRCFCVREPVGLGSVSRACYGYAFSLSAESDRPSDALESRGRCCSRGTDAASLDLSLSSCRRLPARPNDLFSARGNYLLAALAAARILSKRLSPRKSSQHGLKRRSPYVGPKPGSVATISSCSSARAPSPVHA